MIQKTQVGIEWTGMSSTQTDCWVNAAVLETLKHLLGGDL